MPAIVFSQDNKKIDIPSARGWWFYKYKSTEDANKIISKIFKKNLKNMRKDYCQDVNYWNIQCGFIVPKSYQLEQKEYHELLQKFSMNPNNLAIVKEYQRFNYWAVSQAMTAAYSWQYNLAQYPEFDVTVSNPISQFGSTLVMNINKQTKQDFYKNLSNTSFFVYFSRSDCKFCIVEAPLIEYLSTKTGISVWNASLDHFSLPGFKKFMTAPDTILPAEILHVDIVPTLFIYLISNDLSNHGQWIRIATGITTLDVIEERLINFVQAYRHAMLSGFSEGQNKPDFTQLDKSIKDSSAFFTER